MPSTREIRRRIKSVKNIAQVTKAMEAVSAAKMRKAQQQVTATRPYAKQAREVLTYIARLSNTDHELNPLIQPRPVKRVGLLLVTGDRGLAGGFNANVIRRAALFIREQRKLGAEVTVVTVGRKGRDWLLRYDPGGARRVHRHARQPDDLPHRADRRRVLIDDFLSGHTVDEVYMVYTDFINTIARSRTVHKLLPGPAGADSEGMAPEYIFEPSPEAVLSQRALWLHRSAGAAGDL